MTFTDVISRPGDPAPLVPQPVVAQVIQELPEQSALLTLARSVPMSSRTNRMPVLSVLPTAYFVGGDTGLKQTTHQDWENKTLTAEEMAVIVPIPQAYLDDADIPIWDEVRPRIAEAFGALIDAAGFFGVGAPATWVPGGIYGLATTAPIAAIAAGADLGVTITDAGAELAQDGYAVNGFAAAPGFGWRLAGFRNAQGFPIYAPDPTKPIGNGALYGLPAKEVKSGGWNSAEAGLIIGDYSKAIVGLRQDMTFTVHTDGVISDNTGAIVLNLMQQDSVALRCVMRMGFATANPITQLNKGKADAARQPWRVVGALPAV